MSDSQSYRGHHLLESLKESADRMLNEIVFDCRTWKEFVSFNHVRVGTLFFFQKEKKKN